MDGGNRTVVVYARLPEELQILAKRYQNACRMTTFSQALKSLLETHPAICIMAEEVYDGINRKESGP